MYHILRISFSVHFHSTSKYEVLALKKKCVANVVLEKKKKLLCKSLTGDSEYTYYFSYMLMTHHDSSHSESFTPSSATVFLVFFLIARAFVSGLDSPHTPGTDLATRPGNPKFWAILDAGEASQRKEEEERKAVRSDLIQCLRATDARVQNRAVTQLDSFDSEAETVPDSVDPDWCEPVRVRSRGRSSEARRSEANVVSVKKRSKSARKVFGSPLETEAARDQLRISHPAAALAIFGEPSPTSPPAKAARTKPGCPMISDVKPSRGYIQQRVKPPSPEVIVVDSASEDEDDLLPVESASARKSHRGSGLESKIGALAARRASELAAASHNSWAASLAKKRELLAAGVAEKAAAAQAQADLDLKTFEASLLDAENCDGVLSLEDPGIDDPVLAEPSTDPTAPLVDLLSAARLVHATIHGPALGSTSVKNSSVITRITLEYTGQRRTTLPMSQFADFLRASINIDPAFQIHPWDEKDPPAPIFDVSTMRYVTTNFRKYIATRLSIFSHFTGNMRVKLSMSAVEFTRLLEPWCTSQGYKLKIMSCQSLRQSKIGFLLYSSSFVDQVALAKSVRLHSLWATMGGFEFGFTGERFKSESENVWAIMIECDKTQMIRAIRFFTALYNDETVRPPLGTQFYFYVTQFNGGNRATRTELVQIQKTFLLTESKICIGGFGQMDAPLPMTKGRGTVTLRELLMAMRQPSNPEAGLLYGIDERLSYGDAPLETPHFFFRFHRDFRQLIYDRLPTLEEDIRTIIHPSDYHIAILNPNEGLYHIEGMPLIELQSNSDDMSVSTAGGNAGNHFLTLIKRCQWSGSTVAAIPSVVQRTVQRTCAWATPLVSAPAGVSSVYVFPVTEGNTLDFSTPSLAGFATPDGTDSRRYVDATSISTFPTLVSFEPPTSNNVTYTVLWQAQREQNARMHVMEESAVAYRKVVRGVMSELHSTSTKVDSIVSEIGGIKAGQAEVLEYLKHTVGALQNNQTFGPVVDGADEHMNND